MKPRPKFIPLVVVGLVIAAIILWRVTRSPSGDGLGGSAVIEGIDSVVASKIAGRVLEVKVREGDAVTRGQTLVTLDCAEAEATLMGASARVRSAEAQVSQLGAQAEGARHSAAVTRAQVAVAKAQVGASRVEEATSASDLGRVEQLAKEGAVTEQFLEAARARRSVAQEQQRAAVAGASAARLASSVSDSSVGMAESALAAAKAAVDMARADEARARIAVDECAVKAPADGVVTARIVEPGAVVAPGTRLLMTVCLKPAKVTFYVPNRLLAKVRPGGAVAVRVDAWPDRVFRGVITRVGVEAEFTPRNIQTREDRDRLVYAVDAELPNEDGALRAGMPCEVTPEVAVEAAK